MAAEVRHHPLHAGCRRAPHPDRPRRMAARPRRRCAAGSSSGTARRARRRPRNPWPRCWPAANRCARSTPLRPCEPSPDLFRPEQPPTDALARRRRRRAPPVASQPPRRAEPPKPPEEPPAQHRQPPPRSQTPRPKTPLTPTQYQPAPPHRRPSTPDPGLISIGDTTGRIPPGARTLAGTCLVRVSYVPCTRGVLAHPRIWPFPSISVSLSLWHNQYA